MNALAGRRWALIVAPVAAGTLTIVGVIAAPAPGAEGRELVEAHAADPDALNFKSLGYHFAYTIWLAAALGIVGLVRRRGAWLANVAGLLAILGISSIPGFLVSDFIDSAMGRLVGINETVRVGEAVEEQWGLAVMAVSGFAGLLLALPSRRSPPGGLRSCRGGGRVRDRGYCRIHRLRRNPARQRASDGRVRRIGGRAHEDRP